MSADYIPQVGDRIKAPIWGSNMWLDVTYVGRTVIVGDREGRWETTYTLSGQDWIKVTPPVVYPERWITVYTGDRSDADNTAFDRIALIHLASDGTVTLHPVERES